MKGELYYVKVNFIFLIYEKRNLNCGGRSFFVMLENHEIRKVNFYKKKEVNVRNKFTFVR